MPVELDRCIFISYAHKDGADLAARLRRDLSQAGFDTWLDMQRLQGGAIWTDAIEREIDARQLTLVLLTPGSYRSEICRAEQLRALRKGKRVIPVLASKNADRPLHLEARQYLDFSDPGCYKERLQGLLADIRGDITATLPEIFRVTRISYITFPPLVVNYLERPEALCALRNTLFAEDHRQSVALTALAGMGGIGKTVLARALIHDDVVQQAFPDGIVWITMGQELPHDFTQQIREVGAALGDDPQQYTDLLACQNRYRTIIAEKAALIVVDDVWRKDQIEFLQAESSRSRFLFTTRDASIARFMGAHLHTVELLNLSQSRHLLASWTNLKAEQLPPETNEIIRQCGQLPLAISQIGAMLNGAGSSLWADTLELLRSVDLSAIQEQLPPGQESFFRSVEVSYQALSPKMKERYKGLAVLLEDMVAPPAILQTLWLASASEMRRVSRHFVDRSLAQSVGDDGSIRLHDLQLDYVQLLNPDRQALDLVHGAVRLSSKAIGSDSTQFASQIVGRLLVYKGIPAIDRFVTDIGQGAPKAWLRLLNPALHTPGASPINEQVAHCRSVRGVGASADGRRALSVSWDGTVKIWNVESGCTLHTLHGHFGLLSSVAVSADGRYALSASYDATVKIWDANSGSELHTLHGHCGPVGGVAISADGRRAASASWDSTVKVWNVETGQEMRTLRGHRSLVSSVAMSADGRIVVSASWDETVKIWDAESGCTLHTLHGHSGLLSSVAVSADGRYALSASYDATVKIWDANRGSELHTLHGHLGPVNGVAVDADGQRGLSVSDDEAVKLWDLRNGALLAAFTCEASARCCALISGGKIFVGDGGGRIYFLILEEQQN